MNRCIMCGCGLAGDGLPVCGESYCEQCATSIVRRGGFYVGDVFKRDNLRSQMSAAAADFRALVKSIRTAR